MSEIQTCRICHSAHIEEFLDLGNQPYANGLLPQKEAFIQEKKYPLSLYYCHNCSLVQLGYTANPAELFVNYFWVTSTSQTAHNYAEIFCENILSRTVVDDFVMEVASNDGTFLQPFKQKGIKVLGIDPAQNICKIAREKGISTENAFFGEDTAKEIITKNGTPSVLIARNVLPHVANLHDFVKGLKSSMGDNTLLALEFHYAGIICDELHYDSVYHEHLCYFTIQTMTRLLNDYGLYPYDITTSPISGGSLVLYIKNHVFPKTKDLIQWEAHEHAQGYNRFDCWKGFAEGSFNHKKILKNMVLSLKNENKKIIGYGASARSSTMLNFCGINELDCIIDQNPLKQGLFTPGTHIPITDIQHAFSLDPDVILILAWNFKDEILKILQTQCQYSKHIILPLPYPPVLLPASNL